MKRDAPRNTITDEVLARSEYYVILSMAAQGVH
jgi:hypothetical protein